MLEVPSKNTDEAHVFTTLFDRTDEYARLIEEISELKGKVSEVDTSALRRALNPLRRSFEAISSIDFYPGAAQAQTARALDELKGAALAILSPDEL